MGDLQLQLLRLLWEYGPLPVAELHRRVSPDGKLAVTTVATVLRKMEDRGLVAHDTQGRRFIYRAAVREEDVSAKLTDKVLDGVFGGSLTDLVHHLLSTRDIDPAELAEVERMIRERRRKTP